LDIVELSSFARAGGSASRTGETDASFLPAAVVDPTPQPGLRHSSPAEAIGLVTPRGGGQDSGGALMFGGSPAPVQSDRKTTEPRRS
jgi:hypothetical protein